MINTCYGTNKEPNTLSIDSEEYKSILSKYVVFTVPGCKIIKDFSKWLKDDKSIGIYFSDYIKSGLPIYKLDLPKVTKGYPFIVIPKDKLDEGLKNSPSDPIEYLRTKYIVSHIPELICEVK